MATVYTHYKNHDTSDLIKSQEFKDTGIKGIPTYWYRNNLSIETPDLTGYVTISEKKFNRLTRKNQTL